MQHLPMQTHHSRLTIPTGEHAGRVVTSSRYLVIIYYKTGKRPAIPLDFSRPPLGTAAGDTSGDIVDIQVIPVAVPTLPVDPLHQDRAQLLHIANRDTIHIMSCHATMQRALLVLLWLSCCSYALPRVIIRNHKRNPAKFHTRFNTSDNGLKPIDETSYVDFNSAPSITSRRPNVCDNCVCGVGRKTRIVGGNVTSVYEYPWIVSMSKQGTFYCAGSLITRRHVLTAAHCLGGFDKRSIKLVLADNDRTKLDKNAITRRIKSVIMHENFHAATYNNDIAIIEMDRPVDVNGVVRTACLPEDKAIDYTGATATVIGWGRTGESEPVSDELRRVNIPILSEEECGKAGYQPNKITENMFCAGYLEGELDACFGDSGGPLHVKGTFGHLEVIGIISWGRGCARPNFPGIYTKLTNYLGWLKDHLNDECVCPPPRRE